MTNRITRTLLENAVADEAGKCGLDLDINYSSCYGGYQITYNNGSSILMHRKNAKETMAFLDGIHACRHHEYLRSRQFFVAEASPADQVENFLFGGV